MQKLEVGFGNAYVMVLLSAIASLVLGAIVGFGVGAATQSMDAVYAVSLLVTPPVGFVIQSGIISSRLQIPFGRGCPVSLAMIGVAIGIFLVVSIVVYIIASILI